MQIESALILTHVDQSSGAVLLPHIKWLIKTNPDVDCHVIVGEDSVHGKRYNWRNGDQPLRKWWKENSMSVSGNGIAVVEWDTLVAKRFPEIPTEFDLVGMKKIVEDPLMRGRWRPMRQRDPRWTDKNWCWWREGRCFGLSPEECCIGLVSLGSYFMRRQVLDLVCDPKWDRIYSLDVVSELRFPTVAHLSGARIGEIDLPNVYFHETEPGDNGIYHSVKESYAGTL